MRTSEEHIDNMLFNYLEGNLSDGKAQQVEREIASDPLINGELNLWKQSFVHADFYNTTTIEPQLLQSPGSFGFTFFLNSILVVCIALISSTNPKINPLSTSTMIQENLSSLEANKPSSQFDNQLIMIKPKQVKSSTHIVPLQKVAIIERETIDLVSIPELANLSPKSIHFPKKHPKSIEINSMLNAPMITKKELRKKERALGRMKQKAARERMAYEFMKGDIPYIVPVNPNNF